MSLIKEDIFMNNDRNSSPITRRFEDNKVFFILFKDGTTKEVIGKSFREAFETLMPWNFENMRKITFWSLKKED